MAIEPAIKPAAQRSRSGVIGVLATGRTVASAGVARLVQDHGHGVRVLLQACPGLAEQVERGELNGARTEALIERFVRPLLREGADTLVLGCTHYPFLRPLIERAAGPKVAVIDPAPAVARELARRLALREAIASVASVAGAAGAAGVIAATSTERFWTSGPPAQARALIPALWGRPALVRELPPC